MKQQTGDKPVPRTHSKGVIVFSRIASFVFHPLFMTAIAAIALYKLVPGDFSNFSLTGFEFLFDKLLLYTILFPFLCIWLFRISGLISNARMHKARDRILPLIATMIFYFLVYGILISKYRTPPLLQSLLLGSSCAIVIIFIINIFYKVSVHTTASAILPGMAFVLLLSSRPVTILLLLVALIMAAIVGIVRWLLGAHTIGQILLGYTIGMATQIAAYFFINT
ncbi:MAG TPA: hypothetical protein VGQ09_00880 [Chitinophagaceae bacterium]|jgi:hypothetical protein|nr:hypothetical protein [Chitinophagaceae bacterium]